jgi:hypothetical protein
MLHVSGVSFFLHAPSLATRSSPFAPTHAATTPGSAAAPNRAAENRSTDTTALADAAHAIRLD